MPKPKKKLQIALTPDEHRDLKALAQRLGLTMGSALRMGVALLREELDARASRKGAA
jgi:hypothetical protein